MVVAGPPLVCLTISFTGDLVVEVKYDVSGLKATPSPTPIAVSAPMRQSPAYNNETKKAPRMVIMLEASYEWNIDSSASCARRALIGMFSQMGTRNVPI